MWKQAFRITFGFVLFIWYPPIKLGSFALERKEKIENKKKRKRELQNSL